MSTGPSGEGFQVSSGSIPARHLSEMCGVLINRALLSISAGQVRRMAISYIVLGTILANNLRRELLMPARGFFVT